MEIFDEQGEKLVDAFLSIQNKDDLKNFLTDLCTAQEIQSMAQRYQVAQLLKEKKTYDYICLHTGASKATISRVNRALVWGNDGYQKVLENNNNQDVQEEDK